MLYLMRHGQTEWNRIHRLQGKTDIPLNENGRAMAAAAHDEYSSVDLDVCYCSPLKRAMETAQIVLEGRDIPIITDKRLTEMSFGDYEGITGYFDNPDCPIGVLFTSPEKYVESLGGAETFDELYARSGEFLKEVVEPQLKEGKNILIVAHGALNSSIINRLKNIPIKHFWGAGLSQCKMIEVEYPNT